MKARLVSYSVCVTLVTSFSPLASSDQIPGLPQERPVALIGGTIYPVDADPIADGSLVFDRGKIVALGKEISISPDCQVIDVSGKRVYPVLIASATQLGLVEIGAVRATRDESEVGEINPNVRAQVSVNPDSELIPVARANGVGLALSMPSGGLISGSSAFLALDGWIWEEMVVEAPLGIHVHWPRMLIEVPGDKAATSENLKRRDRQLRALEAVFADARAYETAKKGDHPLPVDLRLEALLPVVKGERPVFLHADTERQIRAAVDWAHQEELRAIVVGGRGAARLTGLLKERDVPVIYGPIHRLPGRRDDAYDAPFSGPAELHRAGVRFAIACFETAYVRNLPYHAATAAAYGLPAEEALKAITLYPAEILGVADRVGSLAVGKSATLMVTDGDPLEITTAVETMWIRGRKVDLSSRHTGLYEKYLKRLARQRNGRRF